jgi:hypothetical protein
MTSKNKAILERIERLEEEIAKGREYLANGRHVDWHGFRPLFKDKIKDGKALPPHKDWVKNVFLPAREEALSKAHALFEQVSADKKKKASQSSQPTSLTRRG